MKTYQIFISPKKESAKMIDSLKYEFGEDMQVNESDLRTTGQEVTGDLKINLNACHDDDFFRRIMQVAKIYYK